MAVQAIPTPQRRLSILGDDERDALYRFPVVMEKFLALRGCWSGLTERP